MAPFSKPEAVLKQAEGLVAVGQTHAAIQSLTELFASKRFRSTPLASLEPIMLRFIELCVETRKGRTAKEGLMQYKNIAQNTSVGSIEVVVMRFVSLADQKVRDAQERARAHEEEREKAAGAVDVDVDDLEASETPESILLGAVSGDQSKDRTDRALVTPWLKFLWESYRTSLETLKNNARLEAIYQSIAQQALTFCLNYKRPLEFRRLCDTLRLHLSHTAKYAHQPHAINLADPETLQHHLDTRFRQLTVSSQLELWAEAFRAAEDIHHLLTLGGGAGGAAGRKQVLKPGVLAAYYEQLSRVFLVSGNALYHAAAWGRLHSVTITAPSATEGFKMDEPRLAGLVLISALAVPVSAATTSISDERLPALLSLPNPPSRASLLKDALSRGALKNAPSIVRQLYAVLEGAPSTGNEDEEYLTFDPLTLPIRIAPLLSLLQTEEVLSEYSAYVPLLRRAVVSRLFSQLAEVYSDVEIHWVRDLVAPLFESTPTKSGETTLDGIITSCARRGELPNGVRVRIDHAAGRIEFVDGGFELGNEDPVSSAVFNSGASTSQVMIEEVQPGISSIVRTRLSNVGNCLYRALGVIDTVAEQPDLQKTRFAALSAAVEKERKDLMIYRSLTHRRRELLTELAVRRQKESAQRQADITRKEKEEEERRVKEDQRRREAERREKVREEVQQEEARRVRTALVEKGVMRKGDEALENMDTTSLITMQITHLEKEKKELATKLRTLTKKIDHTERAYRKAEQPLHEQDYEAQQSTDLAVFTALQQSRKEESKARHEEDLATKNRLGRMAAEFSKRRDDVLNKRRADFERKKALASKKIDEEKTKRRATIEAKRAEESRLEEERRRAEEARIELERQQEEARLADEARSRAEAEAAAAAEEAAKREAEDKANAVRKEREAQRAADMEQVRLRAQREEEAEARRLARSQEKVVPTPSVRKPIFPTAREGLPLRTATVTDSTGGGAWRRTTTTTPTTPTAPVRAESPAPGGPAKYTPGAFRRNAATAGGSIGRTGGAATPVRVASPAPDPAKIVKTDDEGFTTVEKPGVWKPKRARQ